MASFCIVSYRDNKVLLDIDDHQNNNNNQLRSLGVFPFYPSEVQGTKTPYIVSFLNRMVAWARLRVLRVQAAFWFRAGRIISPWYLYCDLDWSKWLEEHSEAGHPDTSFGHFDIMPVFRPGI